MFRDTPHIPRLLVVIPTLPAVATMATILASGAWVADGRAGQDRRTTRPRSVRVGEQHAIAAVSAGPNNLPGHA